ncbi:MAG: hypothetical protein LBU42_06720 [Prevotellaceae bacterium]|jgi:hypothetical protein|nr:hypothetical protein [Prevotellaceae bacterium]
MATNPDWIPQNHEALYEQATITQNYLSNEEERARMGFGADTLQAQWLDKEFTPKFTALATAYRDWLNPAKRTIVKTNKLYRVEKVFKAAYRQLYTGFLKNNPLVADSDLLAMGLPECKKGRTHAPVATEAPGCRVDSSKIGRLAFHFYSKGDHRRAKPAGQHGAELVWNICDAPPERWDELRHSTFHTRSPILLTFEHDQRGQAVYFALRWENTRGEKGPYCDIKRATIP